MEVVDMEGAFSFVRQIFGKDLEFKSALSQIYVTVGEEDRGGGEDEGAGGGGDGGGMERAVEAGGGLDLVVI